MLLQPRPEEHALTAAQEVLTSQATAPISSTSIRSEASACDADFVEAAAAAIEEAEYRRMPDDVQAVPHISGKVALRVHHCG